MRSEGGSSRVQGGGAGSCNVIQPSMSIRSSFFFLRFFPLCYELRVSVMGSCRLTREGGVGSGLLVALGNSSDGDRHDGWMDGWMEQSAVARNLFHVEC